MDFVIRFLIFTLTALFSLSVARESWAKHYVWLMIAFVLLAGIIFIV